MTTTRLMSLLAAPEAVASITALNKSLSTMRKEARDVTRAERNLRVQRRQSALASSRVHNVEKQLAAERKEEKPEKEQILRLERRLKSARALAHKQTGDIARGEKHLTAQREQLSKAPEVWREKQTELIATVKEFSDKVVSQGAAFGGEGTSLTAEGLLLKKMKAAAGGAEFNRLVRQLKGRGLSKAILSEVLGEAATPESLALARSLVAAPSSVISRLNAQDKRLNVAADKVGSFVVNPTASYQRTTGVSGAAAAPLRRWSR